MTTVTVIYKSGAKVHFKCKSFSATYVNGKLTEVKWLEVSRTKPLFFGVDEVAAVWEGKV